MKIKTPGYLFRYLFLSAVLFLLLAGCERRKKSEVLWDKSFPRIGSQSSPRATDLNGDGVQDIVIGAGQNEYQHSAQGVLALDGKTGDVLWQAEAEDQVYGSATFYDVSGDGVDDVFIGGRSPNFRALDGKTGKVMWSYTYQYENHPVLQHARFNFNNSVLVPDQNGDGLQDLLTVNGGNSKADPYTEVNRFPAVLLLFDSKTGNIIAADTMPDGRESYMSPVCFLQRGAKDYTIVFGTGGETLPGNLYEVSLSDLAKGDISDATILASEQGHGFIAPPTIADITDDGFYDVVAISHGSTVFAVDGKSRKVLWRQSIPETESSNSLAAGYFYGR
jgi:outer membrane protein assembly factor BamB